jgi:hypothetical protein
MTRYNREVQQKISILDDFFYKALIEILTKHNKQDSGLSEYLLQLQTQPLEFSTFYGMIKIHKTPIAIRPIVATMGFPTYHASKYLDFRLKFIMTNGFSYLKDSQHILLLLHEQITFTSTTTLLSADVVNLYPSIVIDDALKAIRDYILHTNSITPHETNFLMDLLAWVMKNNYIKFSDCYFLQLSGAAMGTPVAVVFAVIYLLQLEFILLSTIPEEEKPLLFKRFIDDIFAVFRTAADAKSFIEKYNTLHESITLTHQRGKKVVFLDLTIEIETPHYYRFKTTIYQKAINKYLYLLPSSYHQPQIFSNFIFSELKRYRLYCSDDDDFINLKRDFHTRLMNRGFQPSYLIKYFSIVITRQELFNKLRLSFKLTHSKATNALPPLIFKTFNTPRIAQLQLGRILQPPEHVTITSLAVDIFDRIIVCLKTTPNINDLFISSKLHTLIADNLEKFSR